MSPGGWFKYSVLGCLGFVVLGLVVLTVVSGLAFFTSRPQQVEDRVLTPSVPTKRAAGSIRGGRVILEVREAELRIDPALPGEPLRVEARYDVNAFALDEQLDPGGEGEDGWSYRATFGRSEQAGAFSGLVSLIRGSNAVIHVWLPVDVPIDLDVDMKEGGAVVRLAGLWLRNAEIDFGSGGFDLSVDEPLREPMEQLSIRTNKGGALLNRLGNASPRRLDVNYSMGGIDMDLSGQWLADAEITIRGTMGGGAVHLPRGVTMEGLDRRTIQVAAESELKAPHLTFLVSTSMGKLEFSD
jgi:hypothetical protein